MRTYGQTPCLASVSTSTEQPNKPESLSSARSMQRWYLTIYQQVTQLWTPYNEECIRGVVSTPTVCSDYQQPLAKDSRLLIEATNYSVGSPQNADALSWLGLNSSHRDCRLVIPCAVRAYNCDKHRHKSESASDNLAQSEETITNNKISDTYYRH